MQKPVGRPPRHDKDNRAAASSERGTKPGEMRKTYIVRIDLAAKIEAIAAQRSTSVKGVVNDALRYMVNKYEQVNGPIDIQTK